MDEASSHLDANILQAAESHGITLYCLLNYKTHELQQFDKSIFKAFQSYWYDEAPLLWSRNQETNLKNLMFGRIFNNVCSRFVTVSKIMARFRATGINKCNTIAIFEEDFEPSSVPEKGYGAT